MKTERTARSLSLAVKGITTDREFAALMSAIMSDVVEGAISPQVANAVVNAGGKLLKVVEMRLQHGKRDSVTGERTLELLGA